MSMVTQNESTTTSFITTMIGGIVAILGGLSTTEQMAILGAIVALAGFMVNTWYIVRKDRREQRQYEDDMKQRRGGGDEAA